MQVDKKRFYKTRFYQSLSCLSTAAKTIHRNIRGSKFEPEIKVLYKFLSPGKVCIDAGGAYGRYALPMSKLVGANGHVYSFEPGSYSHRVISMVVKFHRLKNVTVIKKALSDKSGFMQLASPVKKSGKIGPSLAYLTEGGDSNCILENIEMTTLDEYCFQNNIIKVDFIKSDTEGAELLVFKGAQKVIERDKPVILCEVDSRSTKRFNYTPEALYDFFKQRDYRAFIFDDNKLKTVESLSEEANYFFIPTDNDYPLSS